MTRPAKATADAAGRRPFYHPRTVLRGLEHIRANGLRSAVHRVARRFSPDPPYPKWAARFDTLRRRDLAAIAAQVARLANPPTFGLLLPIGGGQDSFLREMAASVRAQLYPHWRLCVAVGANAERAAAVAELAASDDRIFGGTDLGVADFVAIVDPGIVLPPHALYVLAAELEAHPDADILYADEDGIALDGKRCNPWFKPDWSPALLQSQDYFGPLAVYRATLVREAGGVQGAFAGAEAYDLALRAASRTAPAHIRHIPHILSHRLAVPPGPAEPRMAALRAHLAAAGDGAEVVAVSPSGIWRVKPALPDPPPHVTLIVPTRDRVELLRPCIDGLLHRTRYPRLDVIVVDNDSRDPATFAFFDELAAERRARVLRHGGAFNFSALNNAAAAAAEGELIGLINNDIDVIEPGWLVEMVSQAAQPGVGAVGAKLLYSDDTIQHAGVVLGLLGIAGHPYRHAAHDAAGHRGGLHTVRDVSCVTAACMLVWKRVFDEVGGLDEVNLPVAFNDVDLCLKIRTAGHRIVWTPHAELYHRESASRGSDLAPQHIARFECEKAWVERRWGDGLRSDPFYNPNLTLDDESVGLAWPPRAGKPWRSVGKPGGRGYSAT